MTLSILSGQGNVDLKKINEVTLNSQIKVEHQMLGQKLCHTLGKANSKTDDSKCHTASYVFIPCLTLIHMPSQLMSMSSHNYCGEIVKSKPFVQQIPFQDLAGDKRSGVEVKQPLWVDAVQAMEQPVGGV